MGRRKNQRRAEERIDEARRSGATELNLGSLWLRSLPESLGRLTQLQMLNLYDNQLTSLAELPEGVQMAVGYLRPVRALDASGGRRRMAPMND